MELKKENNMLNEFKEKLPGAIVPNILTAIRLSATAYIPFAMASGDIISAFIAAGIGGITDAFDGIAARKLNGETEFGKKFDQVTDKLFALSAIGSLAWNDPGLLFLMLGEITIASINLHKYKNSDNQDSSFTGKVKTYFLFITLAICAGDLVLNKTFELNMWPTDEIIKCIGISSTFIMQLKTAHGYLQDNSSKKKKIKKH